MKKRVIGRKYLKRKVITTNEPYVASQSRLGSYQYAAGVIQHPNTKLYQVWLSTSGLDVTCLSAHRDVKKANDDLEYVRVLIRSGDLYDEEKTTELFKKLEQGSEEVPQLLPDDLVRQITREILRAVTDRPSQL
jgi:hypothetical protein